MTIAFLIAAAVAVIATAMVITRANAMHLLLYLVISFLAVALIFYLLGAPFVAALEVIVYAGAIMVLFLFALMLLNLRRAEEAQERQWFRLRSWLLPCVLVVVLLAELVYLIAAGGSVGSLHTPPAARVIEPKELGLLLMGPYVLGVLLASILLLAGLVAAHRLTQDDPEPAADVKSKGMSPGEE